MMIPEKDQTISKLLEESKDMLKRFENLVGKDRIEEVSAQVHQQTLQEFEEALEPAADAFFDLFVEEDAMTVLAEFRPPAGGGKHLDLDFIEQVMANKDVHHGIQWEEIRQALEDCNFELKLRTSVVIARGTAPVPLVPAHVQVGAHWTEAHKNVTEGQEDIDFKEISPFVMVNQGDVLAIRVAEALGSPGTDVLGRPVPYPTEVKPEWVPGEHVVDTPVGFEAGVDGRLILAPPLFGVSPVLELPEGVNYKTGNIKFKGEVVIKGRVATGFAIEAGGALVCSDVLDAFQIKVGGDLSTPGGVIGNGLGRVEVGGVATAKFFEHVYLLGQSDVHAEIGVLNSVIKTRGKLIMGDKGVLAGGQVHTLNGVELYQIGTATGPRTEIFAGLDFQGMERILWIRERSKELHTQLKKVDGAIPFGGNRVKDLMAAAKKLRVEIVQLTETAREQLMSLVQNDEASIVVKGTVYPGTLIEICHVQFLVNQKMSAMKFFLDKRKGTIGVESISPAKTTTPSGASRKKH